MSARILLFMLPACFHIAFRRALTRLQVAHHYSLYNTHVVVRKVRQYERRYHSRYDSDYTAEPLQHACETVQLLRIYRDRMIWNHHVIDHAMSLTGEVRRQIHHYGQRSGRGRAAYRHRQQ